jgi:hydroxylamine reductase
VANVLVQNFGIAGIQSVDEDLKLFLQTEKELEEEFEK